MTKLLELALNKLQAATEEDQNLVAIMILKVLAKEEAWNKSFADSQDLLEKMASEAIEEHLAGETIELETLLCSNEIVE